jgi:hypothetical protein
MRRANSMGRGARCFGQNQDRVSPLSEAPYRWLMALFRSPAPRVPSQVAFCATARCAPPGTWARTRASHRDEFQAISAAEPGALTWKAVTAPASARAATLIEQHRMHAEVLTRLTPTLTPRRAVGRKGIRSKVLKDDARPRLGGSRPLVRPQSVGRYPARNLRLRVRRSP